MAQFDGRDYTLIGNATGADKVANRHSFVVKCLRCNQFLKQDVVCIPTPDLCGWITSVGSLDDAAMPIMQEHHKVCSKLKYLKRR